MVSDGSHFDRYIPCSAGLAPATNETNDVGVGATLLVVRRSVHKAGWNGGTAHWVYILVSFMDSCDVPLPSAFSYELYVANFVSWRWLKSAPMQMMKNA